MRYLYLFTMPNGEYFLRQIVFNDLQFVTIPLDKKITVVGKDCFPTLNTDHYLSSQHAKFTRKYIDEWYVQDLGSSYGTFVNGKAIGSRKETVRLGDQIGFGVKHAKHGLVCSISTKLISIKQEPQSDHSVIKSETTDHLVYVDTSGIINSDFSNQVIEEPPSKVIKLDKVQNQFTQQISSDEITQNKRSDEIIPHTHPFIKMLADFNASQPKQHHSNREIHSQNDSTTNYSSGDDVMITSDVEDDYRGYSRNEEEIAISDDDTPFGATSNVKLDPFRSGSIFSTLLSQSNNLDAQLQHPTPNSENEVCFNNCTLNTDIFHSTPCGENAYESDFNNNDSNSSISSHDEVIYPTCVKGESDASGNVQECRKESNKNSDDKFPDSVKKKNVKLLRDKKKKHIEDKHCNVKKNKKDHKILQDITMKHSDELQNVCKNKSSSVAKNTNIPPKNSLSSRITVNTQSVSKQKKHCTKVKRSHQKAPACESIIIQESPSERNKLASYKIPKKSSLPQESSKKTTIVCKQSASRAEFLLSDTPIKRNISKKILSNKSTAVVIGQDLKSVVQGNNQSNKLTLSCSVSPSKKPTTIDKPKLLQSLNQMQKDVPQSNKYTPKSPAKSTSRSQLSEHSTLQSSSTISFLIESEHSTKDNLIFPDNLSNTDQKCYSQGSHVQLPDNNTPLSSYNNKSSNYSIIDPMSQYVDNQNVPDTSSTQPLDEMYQAQAEEHLSNNSNPTSPFHGRSTSSTPTMDEMYQTQSEQFYDYCNSTTNDRNTVASTLCVPIVTELCYRQRETTPDNHQKEDCHNLSGTFSEPNMTELGPKQLDTTTKKKISIDYNHKSYTNYETPSSSTMIEPFPKQLVLNIEKYHPLRSSMDNNTSITSMTNDMHQKQLETAIVQPFKIDYHHRSSTDNLSFNNPIVLEQYPKKLEENLEKPCDINHPHLPYSMDNNGMTDAIRHSTTKFHQQQTDIPVYGTNPTSTESVIQRIVELNYLWLKEQQFMTSPPKEVSMGVNKLPLHFTSFNEYAYFFLPMLMLEMWETLYLESKMIWEDSEMSTNGFCFTITSCESKLPLPKFHCRALIERNSFHPSKGNVILMHVLDLTGSQRHTILGYIDSDCLEGVSKCPPNRNEERGTMVKLWKFSVLVKARNFVPKCNEILKANGICSVTKYLNLLEALRKLDSSSICENILVPNFDSFSIEEPKSESCYMLAIENISKVIEDIHTSNVVLLQSSSGTEKTHFIGSLLETLMQTSGSKPKILVTAPSNDAIDKIGQEIIQLNKYYKKQLADFVLISNPEEVSEELVAFTLDHIYAEQLEIENDLENLQAEIDDLCSSECTSTNYINRRIKELKEIFKVKSQKLVFKNSIGEKNKFVLLSKFTVVLATLDRCFQLNLIPRTQFNTETNFSCCIVDESTRCTELELLQAAAHARKLILIGEDTQQSATVLSKVAFENGYGQSMFTRFTKFESLRGPKKQLF